MGNNTLLQKESNLHKSKAQDIDCRIITATYIKGYCLQVNFMDGTTRLVNFEPAMAKYAKGFYSIYLQKHHFKKFAIENDNIVWGKDWDMIFDPEKIYNKSIETNP